MRGPVLALVAALVLLLAGCSTIPTAGPVQPGTTEAPNGTKLVYVPNPPAPGASQDEIVDGFLTAAGGGGAFRVAKQYLTDAFAKKWDPTTRVLVQETQATLAGSGDVRAEIPVSARVNAYGVYTPASGSQQLVFHLVQQRGQWRIDSAPNGVVLTQSVFQQTYQPRLLQFFDATWSRLVPDRRWFPTTRTEGESGIDPAAIVSALIDGPAGPLTGGVAANALHGATLDGVSPSTGDVTTVTLSTGAAKPSPTTITRMQQQLAGSLGAPTRLVVNDLVVPQAKPIADQLTPQAYVLAGGRFGTLSSTGVFAADPTLGPRIAATKPSAITVSPRQKIAAVQTGAGAVELVTTTGAKPIDTRPGLVAPTLDQTGWVYTVTGSGGLQAANGRTTTSLGGDLGTGAILAIQVSPDGTRLLVLVSGQTGLSAFVAGIERNASGEPTGLTGTGSRSAVDLGSAGASGSGGATWIDDDDVAVLVNGTDSDQILTQQLGGISGTLGPFANVTTIVGTTTSDDLRIRVQSGQSGTVYVWSKTNWLQQSQTSSDIAVLAVQR